MKWTITIDDTTKNYFSVSSKTNIVYFKSLTDALEFKKYAEMGYWESEFENLRG